MKKSNRRLCRRVLCAFRKTAQVVAVQVNECTRRSLRSLAKQRRHFRPERPNQVSLFASQHGWGEPSIDGLTFGVFVPEGNEALAQRRRS